MGAPSYSAAEFGEALLQLMPTGRAWSRDSDAVMPQVVRAQGGAYARLHTRSNYLLVDAFPATAVELLPDWEYAVGLPDPCAGPDATIVQRQAHVVARLTQSTGPSIPELTAFAAALGYAITITEFAPAQYGGARFGDRFLEAPWAHAWRITVTGGSLQSARYGTARFGERFQTFGNDVLECEMRRLAPAHTVLTFAYTDPNAAAANPPGVFILGRDVLAG